MNIWLINHYAVPPKYYPLARQTNFAKYLMAMGHTVTIFAASSVHNSDVNLITDGRKWREETVDGVHYVYIKCCDYQGSGLKRVYNICEFAWKLPGVCKQFPKPDAIVATSMPPTSCAMGVRMGRKWGCKTVAEIADLWPESIVAYGIAGPHNPAVLFLRWLEKWIYKKADAVVFTMEGAYDYITEQGWEKDIPRSKVHYINNGVDLKLFNYNKEHYHVDDPDLLNPELFKIVFTGTLVTSNNIDGMLDLAKRLQKYPNVRFLIWGNGEYTESMLRRIDKEQINNVCYKGFVDKKYVPFIVSHADVNFMHAAPTSLYRYGASPNKLFDYLAAGCPIFQDFTYNQDIVQRYRCGITCDWDLEKVMEAFEKLYHADKETVSSMRTGAQKAAMDYDFEHLTEKLLQVIVGIRKP